MKRTTKESFSHFISDFFPSLSEREKKEMNERFYRMIPVREETVQRWVLGKNFPKGEELLRLRFFLISLGYEIVELEDCPEEIFVVGKLVAFDLVSLETATEKLGCPDTSELLRYLNGYRNPSKNKLNSFKEFLLDEKEAIDALIPFDALKDVEKKNIAENPSFGGVPDAHILEKSLDAIVSLCEALRPALEHLHSGDAETREKFRERIKFFAVSNAVYGFAGLLNDLCSEKSMEVGNAKKN